MCPINLSIFVTLRNTGLILIEQIILKFLVNSPESTIFYHTIIKNILTEYLVV